LDVLIYEANIYTESCKSVVLNASLLTYIPIVPDLGSRSRVVIFGGAGCWGNLRRALGIWNGEGWEGVEKGEVSSRVSWDQGGRDPITARRVSK
jgi:hypothetical protein